MDSVVDDNSQYKEPLMDEKQYAEMKTLIAEKGITANDFQDAIKKINKVNKIKAFGAITLACILGLTNQ